MFQCLWQLDLCLTITYLVAGTSVATESTECTVVELSIPIMTDPVESLVDDMAENIYMMKMKKLRPKQLTPQLSFLLYSRLLVVTLPLL